MKFFVVLGLILANTVSSKRGKPEPTYSDNSEPSYEVPVDGHRIGSILNNVDGMSHHVSEANVYIDAPAVGRNREECGDYRDCFNCTLSNCYWDARDRSC